VRVTNKFGLPEFLAEPAKEAYRTKCDYSVTELVRPPQITRLSKIHKDQLEVDISDQLWILLGRAVHDRIGARAKLNHDVTKKVHVEEQLSTKVGEQILAGTPDMVEVYQIDGQTHATIYDFKVTSVWSFVLGDKPEWETQLRLYQLLVREAYSVPFENITLKICAILRDWTGQRARREPDYPQLPYHEVEVATISRDDVLTMAKERIAAIEDGTLCNETDRWQRETTFAVMKEGRKTAVKVFSNSAEATEMVTRLGGPHYIEERPNNWNRCEQYCPVSKFCNQYQEHVAEMVTTNMDEIGL